MFRKSRSSVNVDNPQMQKRIQSLTTDQLVLWFENTVAGVGELVDAVVRHGAPADEVTKSLESMLVMWREYQSRETTM
jgi:hypothetical protein